MPINKSKILQLLKHDEGFKLDFKLKISLELDSEKKEFVKDVIAIANTPGGRGYIIFGVEDQTREIVGINKMPKDIEERIQMIIANRVTPPVPVNFDIIEVDKKIIGVVTIFKSIQIPHQMIQTGAFYIRRGSTTDKATRGEIANMLQQYGMLSFENVPCRRSSLENLDEKMLKIKWGDTNKHNIRQLALLSSLGVISTDYEKEIYYPTYGGLLLFGKRPQDFIPQALIEVKYKDNIIGIDGNILQSLKAFEVYMKSIVSNNYPITGLVEVLTNALIHRNYWNNMEYTHVIVEDECIKVTNPMSHELYQGKNSYTRVNPWLYSRMLVLCKGENDSHIGIGIEKAKELFGGELKIETNIMEGTFEVILPGDNKYMI